MSWRGGGVVAPGGGGLGEHPDDGHCLRGGGRVVPVSLPLPCFILMAGEGHRARAGGAVGAPF